MRMRIGSGKITLTRKLGTKRRGTWAWDGLIHKSGGDKISLCKAMVTWCLVVFGGLQENRQIVFEQRAPWLSGDLTGVTIAGWDWEMMKPEKRKAELEKRPKQTIIQCSGVDIRGGRRERFGIVCGRKRLSGCG